MSELRKGELKSISPPSGYEQTEALSLPASHFTHPDDAPKLYHAYQYVLVQNRTRMMFCANLLVGK